MARKPYAVIGKQRRVKPIKYVIIAIVAMMFHTFEKKYFAFCPKPSGSDIIN